MEKVVNDIRSKVSNGNVSVTIKAEYGDGVYHLKAELMENNELEFGLIKFYSENESYEVTEATPESIIEDSLNWWIETN